MKNILITLLLVAVIFLGYKQFQSKEIPPSSSDTTPTVQQQASIQNQSQTSTKGFISPTSGSYTLGQEIPIKIKTSPQWFHCSNGFYLYDTYYNKEVGPIGILTENGKTSYSWSNSSKRYATCGTGVGEIPITVEPGSYKICLKESNTETGIGESFYCSDSFTLSR